MSKHHINSADQETWFTNDEEISRFLSEAQVQLHHAAFYIGCGNYTTQQWNQLSTTLDRLGRLAPTARIRGQLRVDSAL